ncbi:MAG: sulfatase [Verrucomicrobiota bacterium]
MLRRLLCATLFALVFSSLPSGATTPPNIVYILSDDQAWTDYGFMDHPAIETPHLDKLADRSAAFPRAYVPTALCRPSLMTLATGLYAHQHMVTGNDPAGKPKRAKGAKPTPEPDAYKKLREQLISNIDNHPTLPKLLGEAGYLSHQSGKWWEGNYSRGGFTHGMTRGFPEPGGRHGDDGLKIGREGMAPVFEFIDHALAENKPFFLWYAPFMPHTPHTPPDRLFNKYREKTDSPHIARYYAMCEWFDETCGQLINYIDEKGLTNNTVFVYICDNGWIQKPDANGFDLRSKQSPYEGGVRQPTLISWPGVIKPHRYENTLISSIDLFPTSLSAAGITPPADVPGLDLMPLIRDGIPLDRNIVFGEGCAHDIIDLTNHEPTLLYRWCIEGKWKLLLTYDGIVSKYTDVHARQEKGPQLFNLSTDPHEEKNVAAQHPDIVADLAKKIEAWYPVKTAITQITP